MIMTRKSPTLTLLATLAIFSAVSCGNNSANPAVSGFDELDAVLAGNYDERFGGDLCHVVVMQHVTKERIDAFIKELEADRD